VIFLRQTWAIARRDLLIEGRAGEVSAVVFPFAVVAVFVVPLASDTLAVRLGDLAAPVYWLIALLFGMHVTLRQTGSETRTQRRHLVLLGIDPAARIAGRAVSAAALTFALLLATGPLVILFYDPEPIPRLWVMVPTLLLFASGLSLLATLAGDLTAGLRARSALAPLIVVPLAIPLLVGASQVLESLIRQRSTLTGTLVLVLSDLALAATVALAARALEEATT
jgi:heme exporter protein B